ncbi:MAG: type II secretion system secretin GspD [Armatimonadota bacterium]
MNIRRASWGVAAVVAVVSISALTSAQQSTPGQPGVRMPGRRARPNANPPLPSAGNTGPASATPTAAAAAARTATPSPESQPLEVFQSAGGQKMIRMEFYGLDIDFLLRLLSREAGVTIIKAEQVTGPITVIAPEPVPLDVAFQILNSVLQVRGFTMIRAGTGIYKVVPVTDAIASGPPVGFGNRPEDIPSTDTYITQVIPLVNVDASDVASQIQGLLSQNASLIPTSTNSLIITDTAANIQRVLSIIEDTESQLSGGLRVFSLQSYDAEDMCDLVNTIIIGRGGAGGGAGGAAARRLPFERRVTGGRAGAAQTPARPGVAAGAGASTGPEFCYPDTRTNSMIVLATPIHTRQIQQLVDQLDRPINLKGSFFVYPVQNLVASDLAQKIGPLISAQVLTGAGGPAAGARPGVSGSTATRSGAIGGFGTPGYGIGTPITGGLRTSSIGPDAGGRTRAPGKIEVEPLSGSAGARGGSDPITIAQASEAPIPVAPQPAAPPSEGSISTPSPEIAQSVGGPSVKQPVMTADDNTNTLLISASPAQLDLVRQLLDQLDVAPPQVQIQAIIAEVTLTQNTSLGFQWESLGRVLGTFRGGTFTGDISSNFGLDQLTTDTNGNVTGPSGLFGQISGPQFHAVLNALTTDSHARILSAPSIFTSNNQQAQIDVSSSQPFPQGSLTTSVGTGAAVSTSITYQSVGIVLTVTPRVTQGNMVQMDVSVSADEPGASVNIAGQDYPSVNARRTQANLNVKDGNTIILSGLMRDTITRTGSRVPILGDLPLIGSLFRSTTSDRQKSELLVFLTPHVVRTPAEAAALTDKIKNNMLETPRSLRGPSDASAPAPDTSK